jgi:hypothetical protein
LSPRPHPHKARIPMYKPDEVQISRVVEKVSGQVSRMEAAQLTKAVLSALRLTEGEEETAAAAVVITDGRPNRLRRCVELLQRFGREVTERAYHIHDHLLYSHCNLQDLCGWMLAVQEYGWTDDGLADFLEGIGERARSVLEEGLTLKRSLELLSEHYGDASAIEQQLIRERSAPYLPGYEEADPTRPLEEEE